MNEPASQLERDLRDLDRYQRGEVTPAERDAVAARLAREPALGALAAEHDRVSASLRRSFAPPPPPIIDGVPGEPPSAPPAPPAAPIPPGGAIGPGLLKLLLSGPGLAGAVVLVAAVVTGGWLLWRPGAAPGVLPTSPLAAYAEVQRRGFTATFPESDPRQLSILISNKLSHELVFRAGEGVEYVGVRTLPGGSPLRLLVLAKVRGRDVLVVLDVVGAAGVDLPSTMGSPSLRAHHARVGQVDALELTPHDAPGVLPLISAP